MKKIIFILFIILSLFMTFSSDAFAGGDCSECCQSGWAGTTCDGSEPARWGLCWGDCFSECTPTGSFHCNNANLGCYCSLTYPCWCPVNTATTPAPGATGVPIPGEARGRYGFFFYLDSNNNGVMDTNGNNSEAKDLRNRVGQNVRDGIEVRVISPNVEQNNYLNGLDDSTTVDPLWSGSGIFNLSKACGTECHGHCCNCGYGQARNMGDYCSCLYTAGAANPALLAISGPRINERINEDYAFIVSSIKLGSSTKTLTADIRVPQGYKITNIRVNHPEDRTNINNIVGSGKRVVIFNFSINDDGDCPDKAYWQEYVFNVAIQPSAPTPTPTPLAYIFGKAVREDAGGNIIERWTAGSECDPNCDSDCRAEPNLDIVCSGGGFSSGADWKCNQVGMTYYKTDTVFTPGSDVTCTLSGLPLGYVCKDPAQGTTTCTRTKSNVVSGIDQNYLLFSIKPGTVSLTGGTYNISQDYNGSLISCGVFNSSPNGVDGTITFDPTGVGSGYDCANAPPVPVNSSKSTGYTSSDLRYNCQYRASAQADGLFQVVTQITGVVNPDDCQNGDIAIFTPNDSTTGEVNFGLAEIAGSWLQVVGGDVTSYSNSVNVNIPASCAGSETCLPYIDIDDSGVSYPVFNENGVVSANGAIDYGGADESGVGDPNDWQVANTTLWREQGKGVQYYASLLADRLGSGDDISGNANISEISGLADGTVGNGETEIKVVRGNLTIDQNISVTRGGLLLMLVAGNISIDPDVSNIEGIFITDGSITILGSGSDQSDPQLILEGSYVTDANSQGNEGLTNSRDRGAKNNLNPPALFRYRPDLVVNLLRANLPLGSVLDWEELAP